MAAGCQLGDQGFRFDLNAPFRVEQGGNDHGRCGPDGAKDFTVGAADFFPVLGTGEEHAGAVNMLESSAGLVECGFDQLEHRAGLLGRREVVGSDRTGARNVDDVADAHGA